MSNCNRNDHVWMSKNDQRGGEARPAQTIVYRAGRRALRTTAARAAVEPSGCNHAHKVWDFHGLLLKISQIIIIVKRDQILRPAVFPAVPSNGCRQAGGRQCSGNSGPPQKIPALTGIIIFHGSR